jgi:glycosyltransferase involved in cell wall biosynthesis
MAQNLRVLLLIPHLGGGGAEKVTALLARGLSKDKYEMHLALVTQKDAQTETLPPWVAVHALGAHRVRTGAFRLLRLVRQLKPDAILSGMAHLNFLVLLLRPFFPRGTRVLIRQNETVSAALAFGGLEWYAPLLYRLLYRHADRIICQSRAMADDLAWELGIEKGLIAVLPNPVDFEEILEAAQTPEPCAAFWRGPGPHLLAMGRLAPEKGFDVLLQAFVAVREKFPHAELIVAGKGLEEEALKTLGKSLGLEAAVLFPGYLQRPYSVYSGASVFVLSSRHEGMPNALLEAAAAGLPIVSTPASGGVIDLLRNMPGAWVARETAPVALASTLLEALAALGPEQRFHRSFNSSRKPKG